MSPILQELEEIVNLMEKRVEYFDAHKQSVDESFRNYTVLLRTALKAADAEAGKRIAAAVTIASEGYRAAAVKKFKDAISRVRRFFDERVFADAEDLRAQTIALLERIKETEM